MRAPVWVGLLALNLLVFSGCISNDAPTDDGGESSAVVPPQPTAVGYTPSGEKVGINVPLAIGEGRYTGLPSFEPTIGVTQDGTLFITAFGFASFEPTDLDNLANIARSTDQGATWEVVTAQLPGDITNPPNSNDPYVWVDYDTGRVFTNDLQALVCSWLNYSDDLGETWITNPVGCGMPPGVHDHQTIGTAHPRMLPTVGYDNVVYYCVNRVADSVCATSLNGGLSFGPLIPVFEGLEPSRGTSLDAFCGGLHGHIKSAPDGTVYLPKGQCGVASVARSEDDGLTWRVFTINQTVGAQGHEVSVSVDEAGNVFAFWMGLDGLPYFAASTDRGETWSDGFLASPPGVTATDFPAVAAGAEGRIAFAYVGTTVEGGYAATEEDMRNAAWNGYIGVVTNALDAEPVIQTVMVNPEDDPIAPSPCGQNRCLGIGDFIDIVIDAEGRPWAALGDYCYDGTCNGPELGLVGTLTTGPALRGELIELSRLPPVPAEAQPAGG